MKFADNFGNFSKNSMSKFGQISGKYWGNVKWKSQIATEGLGFYYTIFQIPLIKKDGFRYNFLSAHLAHVLYGPG